MRRTALRCFVPASHNAFLGDLQKSFADTARQFALTTLRPNASKWDELSIFPEDALREAAKLGFAAMYVSEPYGTAATRLDASVVFEQLAMEDPSTTAYLTIHNMCAWMVDSFGSDELKAKYLPKLASMELIASYCLTEPSSGSDAAGMKTIATPDGGDYLLTGTKSFISGAGASSVYIVMSRTPEGKVTAFLVDRNEVGGALTFGKNETKMGWKSQPTRQTIMDKARVPKGNMLGKEGEGFKIAMKGLDGGRINIATCSLGAAQRCYDLALAYTKERKQFGTRIADFQNTQFSLAEMAGKIHISRLLIRQAAVALDQKDKDATVLCAMAKQQATELCYEVVDKALQLHGGYGYLKDYQVERYLRDLRVHRILEGTNEIMRHIVARSILADK